MNPETNDERVVELLKEHASLMVFRKRYDCSWIILFRRSLIILFDPSFDSSRFLVLVLYLFFDPFIMRRVMDIYMDCESILIVQLGRLCSSVYVDGRDGDTG